MNNPPGCDAVQIVGQPRLGLCGGAGEMLLITGSLAAPHPWSVSLHLYAVVWYSRLIFAECVFQLFNVGSGLTDKIRKAPPVVGSIITYRFQELTRDGVPRYVW